MVPEIGLINGEQENGENGENGEHGENGKSGENGKFEKIKKIETSKVLAEPSSVELKSCFGPLKVSQKGTITICLGSMKCPELVSKGSLKNTTRIQNGSEGS